jgi:hypothetical protein
MSHLLTYLRLLAYLIAIALAVITTARTAVWLTATDLRTGLSGAPEVYNWSDPRKTFGGYSALIVDPDGTGFIAGSDRQHYLTGTLTRDGAGRITGASDVTHWPVRLGKITQTTRFQGDLEGLTRLSDGRIGMAFENFARIQIMDAPGEIPKGVHKWDVFEDVFGNELFEAIATLPDDTLLALFQRGDTRGQTPAYHYDGTDFTGPAPFPVTPGFDVSGADTGPDGCLYILERRYGLFTGFQFQLIRMNAADWTAPRALLYRSKPMSLGNAEGVSIWQNGATLTATLITDNGFPPMQPTRLIELPLAPNPAPDCADQ